MIRVIIAEDHHLVRQGIRALIEKAPDIEVIAEAADGQEAVERCEQLQPDVLVVDIVMPRLNGLQTIERLRVNKVSARPIILSMHSDEAMVRQALTLGAKGYVLKQAVAEELLLAIRAAMRGEVYLSPAISSILIEAALQGRGVGEPVNAFEQLSLREREVLQLLAEGYTNGEVAKTLFLSEKTIEKHRAALMEKLNVRNLAGLVKVAIKHGLISLNE